MPILYRIVMSYSFIKMYSTTPLSKFDPLINLPDNKKSTEIKKKNNERIQVDL